MKGFVPTPPATVDLMVRKLFHGRAPRAEQTVLDPGCGAGAFLLGVLRWCARRGLTPPRLVGVESDPRHLAAARAALAGRQRVELRAADFLERNPGSFDLVIGNPPYVSITGLDETEKAAYRSRFVTAHGRFDLYLLFFEQALRALKPDGRLVFITPEKFLYVESAAPLRRLLAGRQVEELHQVAETTFGPLVTYPLITTVGRERGSPGAARPTRLRLRDGSHRRVSLPDDGRSWQSSLGRTPAPTCAADGRLGAICRRISCGVATGADAVFLRPTAEVPAELARYAYPTIAGRELAIATDTVRSRHSLLLPYDETGRLLPAAELGALGATLVRPEVRARLERRTCVLRKPWYAFHETPPLLELLRPKILCKDIAAEPRFWADRSGRLVPRHSVYYLVPRDPERIDALLAYLNGPTARRWLQGNCQRAANGFLRLQSRVLRGLPLPAALLEPAREAPVRPAVRAGAAYACTGEPR
ncbi:MAG: N-6 DNA methylase [Planctomycetes bacterium]|nr:N-6 DNA methylase [Planctomycetota bacterium]